MSKRLYLAAGFALSLLAVSPSTSPAQGRITVEWQNAPLSHVIRGFARFSGKTIVLASDVGDPEVTAAFRNIDWRFALSDILDRQGLVTRVDATGVIRVERRPSAPSRQTSGRN